MNEAKQVIYEKKVEFHETDMAGIAHFSNFFRYMEFAEARFFEEMGEPLIHKEKGWITGWPRVDAACKFKRPVNFGDTIHICLSIREIKIRAIVYEFKFYTNQDFDHLVASGSLTTVYAKSGPEEPMASASIPSPLLDKLEKYCRL